MSSFHFGDLGVLGSCFELVDPVSYYEGCVYDLCVTLPDDDLVCDNMHTYATACREAGGEPGNWRSELPQCGKSLTLHTPSAKLQPTTISHKHISHTECRSYNYI